MDKKVLLRIKTKEELLTLGYRDNGYGTLDDDEASILFHEVDLQGKVVIADKIEPHKTITYPYQFIRGTVLYEYPENAVEELPLTNLVKVLYEIQDRKFNKRKNKRTSD